MSDSAPSFFDSRAPVKSFARREQAETPEPGSVSRETYVQPGRDRRGRPHTFQRFHSPWTHRAPGVRQRRLFEHVPAVEFDDPVVNQALPEGARRILAIGLATQETYGPGSVRHSLARYRLETGLELGEVTRALRLLTEAGLHAYEGQAWVNVRGRPVRCHCRSFYAEPTAPDGRTPAGLELRAWAAGQAAKTWGGRRPGAGRPRRTSEPLKSETREPLPQAESSHEIQDARQRGVTNTMEEDSLPSGENPPRVRAGTRCTSRAMLRPGEAFMTGLRPRPVADSKTLHLGRRRDPAESGEARAERFRQLLGRTFPPFPGAAVVGTASAPPPRPLPGAWASNAEKRDFLLRAWESATHDWRPAARRVTVNPHSDKWRPLFDQAIGALQERRIAPAQWVRFSMHAWDSLRAEARVGQFPKLSWVFSANRIHKHAKDWFAEWYQINAIVPSVQQLTAPSVRVVVELWQSMMLEVRRPRVRLETRDDALYLLDQYFPGDKYEVMVANAKAELAMVQRRAVADVAAGGVGRV